MLRTLLLRGVGSALLLVLQAPASAGGWWTTLDFHDQYVAVGESLSIKIDEVLFGSIEAAERAEDTQYFAYVVKDFDQRSLDKAMSRPNPEDWWRPLTPPIRVGTVALTNRDANLTRGRVHLDMPEIPTGGYSLMLCDAGCQNPLANHIPIPVNITSDALAAQTARRLDKTNDRLTLALARVRHDVRQTQRELRRMQGSATAAASEADGQSHHQVPVTNRESRPPWIAYAGWFLAGVLAVFVVMRPRRDRLAAEIVIERVPDDARELMKTP